MMCCPRSPVFGFMRLPWTPTHPSSEFFLTSSSPMRTQLGSCIASSPIVSSYRLFKTRR
jgi:hypothetical protein